MSTQEAKQSKFTDGPWEWVESPEYGYTALWNPDTRVEIINSCGINDGDSPITWLGEEMSDEDANLIAAAPDLLEALKAVVTSWRGAGDLGGQVAAMYRAEASIAKAEGRSS